MKLIAKTDGELWRELFDNALFSTIENMINYFHNRYEYTKFKIDLEKGKLWLLESKK
jgi:hypothetical protein